MFSTLVLAVALVGSQQCWDIFDGALRHNAQSPHPPYVSYSERISVTGDDYPILYTLAHVDYRDDGVARIEDQRFNYQPIFTNHAEPGPPELGPYGSARAAWLPLEGMQQLPVISSQHIGGNITCTAAARENYKGRTVYRLVFGNTRPDRPAVKAVWIDASTSDVWKLIVSGYVFFADPNTPPPLTDFEVELGYVGPYLVVNHVVWKLTRREFSQDAHYFGEYTLSGFEFPNSLPPGQFGDAATKR